MKDICIEKINNRKSPVGNALPQLVETPEKNKNEHFKKLSKISGTFPLTSSVKVSHTTPAVGTERLPYNVRPRLNTLPQRRLKNADASDKTHLMKRSSSHEESQTTVTRRSDGQLGEHYGWNDFHKLSLRSTGETGRRRWSRDSLTSPRRHSTDSALKARTVNGNNSSTTESRYGTWARHNSHDGTKTVYDESLSTNPVSFLDSRNNSSSPTTQSTDNINDTILNQRRWSRPNFAITSRRVSLLLGWKKVLHDPTKKNNIFRDTTHSTDTKHELPKQPRFSSFMSPEAQYALMKGYEDKLHDKLSETYPEYNGLLKRNKTPHSHINIRMKSCIGVLGDAEEEEEEEEFVEIPINLNGDIHTKNETEYDNDKQNSQGNNDQIPTTEPLRSLAGIAFNPSFDSSSTKSEPHKAKPTDALKNLRRLSLSFVNSGNVNNLFESDLDDTHNDIFSLRRQSSLPSLCSLPSDRRIMMSYRLESAMDILDTIRDKDEVPLSPRIKAKPRLCAPLPEYNTWASDWSREFKMKQGKA